MAEEANAPAAVEDTTQTTRPNDTSQVSPVADAKSVNGGDVAAEGAVAEDKDQTTAEQDPPVDKTAPTDATSGDTKADTEVEMTTEPVATNGTPGPKKGGNRRKSGASVPEHKKKTPAKKKGPALHLDVEPGEIWFLAMKGYPPWPVIICDEAMLPEALLMKRPVSARRVDGTYREDFREGGKNAKDRRYPVMFLGTNEFAWQVNTELQPLDVEAVKHEVETGHNKAKKSKALWQAYEIAAQGRDLNYFKELLNSHEQAMQADIEEKEAAAEAKQNKKAKRKSTAVEEAEDADMEDADDTAASSVKKPKSAKKRKAENEAEPEKPAKTPKTKLKLTAPKEPSAAKPKKEPKPKKSKAKSESEEAEVPKLEEKPMTDAERREKQEKSVLYLRHRLQKGFLSRDQAPKEDEMSNMDDYLRQLETTENLDAEVIKKTKVHKVLRAIVKLNTSIPKEAQYDFKGRSSKLLQKWTSILSADGEAGETGAPAAEPATNGVNHDRKSEAASTEGKPEATTETTEAAKAVDGDGDVAMADAKAEEPAVKSDSATSPTPAVNAVVETTAS